MTGAAEVLRVAAEHVDDLPELAREPARAALAELLVAAPALDVLGAGALQAAREAWAWEPSTSAAIEALVSSTTGFEGRRELLHLAASEALAARDRHERAAAEVIAALTRAGMVAVQAAWPLLAGAL